MNLVTQDFLVQFENQCSQEQPPACQSWCPLHVEARNLISQVIAGRLNEALRILDRHMPLSSLGGFLCEGPCQNHCQRTEIDHAVNLPLIERFILKEARQSKPMLLPRTGRSALIVGADLAALAAAWELAKKGHQVTVIYQNLATRLKTLPSGHLPPAAIESTLELLSSLGITFEQSEITSDLFEKRLKSSPVFLALDDPALPPDLAASNPDLAADPVTLETNRGFFAGPFEPGFIQSLSAGKKAAASIDRVLQGVNPASAREKEATGPTRLATNIKGVVPSPQVTPKDPLNPSADETATEASRCLLCQCLDCVKLCPHLSHYKGYPKKLAREIYNNIATAYGIRSSNIMINSCAQCGLCKEICPHGADLGSFIAAAKLDMVASNHMPVSAHEFALEDLVNANAPESSFLRLSPDKETRYLFFPGCQLTASSPDLTEMTFRHLSNHLSTGLWTACCGAPARWSGRPKFTASLIKNLTESWEKAGKPELIMACSSCRLFFQAELPMVPVRSLWNILAQLPLPKEARPYHETLSLHDPCAARHDDETQKNVRLLLDTLGQNVEVPEQGGRLTRCCGYGGLAAQANPEMGQLYAENIADTEHDIVAYCVMCRDSLKRVGKRSFHLLNLLFPDAENPDLSVPGPSVRNHNRRLFRQNLLTRIWGETLPEDQNTPNLQISEELSSRLDSRRILVSDLKTVMAYAEEHGPQFHNDKTGRDLLSLRPRQVTFWVEYEKKNDIYIIHDAWCHRMLVPGIPGEGQDSPASLEGFAAEGKRI